MPKKEYIEASEAKKIQKRNKEILKYTLIILGIMFAGLFPLIFSI